MKDAPGEQEEEGSREDRRKRDLRQRNKEKLGKGAQDLISSPIG